MLDALADETLEERVEAGDGKGNPARARLPPAFGSMKSVA